MFEIIITIHLIASNADMIFRSEEKFQTMLLCTEALPRGYEYVRAHVLDHLIEQFTVERKCGPVEEGA